MKRRKLIETLRVIAADKGLNYREAEGGEHTRVWIGEFSVSVPRHREINELTAKAIIKQARAAE